MRAIGIAIATDHVETTTWSCPLTPWTPGAAAWDDLRAALAELRGRLGLAAPRAAIALIPPLAQCRLLELPALGREEYARVLTRDAARYFPTGRIPQIAGAEPLSGRRSP